MCVHLEQMYVLMRGDVHALRDVDLQERTEIHKYNQKGAYNTIQLI